MVLFNPFISVVFFVFLWFCFCTCSKHLLQVFFFFFLAHSLARSLATVESFNWSSSALLSEIRDHWRLPDLTASQSTHPPPPGGPTPPARLSTDCVTDYLLSVAAHSGPEQEKEEHNPKGGCASVCMCVCVCVCI